MKIRRVIKIWLLAGLSLLFFAGIAFADGPPPESAMDRPDYPYHSKTEPFLDEYGKFLPGSIPPGAGSPPDEVSITLGSPGFSLWYSDTVGITEEPYIDSINYLNSPGGLYIDSSDNLYVTENRGCRVLRFNSSLGNTLTLGNAGVCYTDDYVFSLPGDIALDLSGNIWVADGYHRVVQYDSSGNYLQSLPEENPWESGSDNTHFDYVTAVAFDSGGRMFVADTYNHRVQVYTFSAGSPVYQATIGVTGVSGSDNAHFNQPISLYLDSSDNLYVSDFRNDRVQKCVETTGWSCSPFGSGFTYPNGLTVDSSDNVFVADSGNNRVVKCTSGGSCSDFATGLPGWIEDVALDSTGNVFVSDDDNNVIYKFNSSGVNQGVHLGNTGIPYQTTTTRMNNPTGLTVTSSGSVYVAEGLGYRLLKYDSGGSQTWAVGEAGVPGNDNAHFGAYWGGPDGDLALDSSGKIYVPDTANHRVQVYTSAGSYSSTFGSYGSGNAEFDQPSGVAIHPVSGDIYVVDRWNHRVQVYDSSWTYKATLGVTGVSGSDSSHFDQPQGIAVDSGTAVYVSDTENHRVQKCAVFGSGGSCTTFAGQTGTSGDDFDHLGSPQGLAVDSSGRVYVADYWNNRVMVYDSTGAYLTTVAGAWGSNSSQFRGPQDVAVDSSGTLYVADTDHNHRVQLYDPDVIGWDQTNLNAFGDRSITGIFTLANFQDTLYAATYQDNGAEIWSASTGSNWSQEMSGGFGDADNVCIDHLYEFGSNLYAGTCNDTGGELWRSTDGSAWSPITTNGFGDTNNDEIIHLAAYGGNLYASTWIWESGVQGAEIWRSSTGDAGSWSLVVDNGFGDIENSVVLTMLEFNSNFYAATGNRSTGGEIWRSASGDLGSWTQINSDGFGDSDNSFISGLEVFEGYLYAITHHNDGAGSEVWRCQTCDGTDWIKKVDNGFGDSGNRGIPGLYAYAGRLFAFVTDYATGLEVWSTLDGENWLQAGGEGFGDSNNRSYWDNGFTIFEGHLYVGTINHGSGAEVWVMQPPEMDVKGAGQSIADGDNTPSTADDTDYGTVDVSSGSEAHIFTVQNTGERVLHLYGSPKVALSGTHAGDFSVTSQPFSPIMPLGGSTTFEITFDPSAEGLRTALVSIPNDDPDERPYTFTIQGTGELPSVDPSNPGLYVPSGGKWYLKNDQLHGWSNFVTVKFAGPSGAPAVTGDWNNDGIETPGFYVPSAGKWYLKNDLVNGWNNFVTVRFAGPSGALPVAGDWNNDGVDTIGFYVPSAGKWYLKNDLNHGWSNFVTVRFPGPSGSEALAGDWNNSGSDTIGFYVPSGGKWYLKNDLVHGWNNFVTVKFAGPSGSQALAGDWNADGTDTIAFYVPSAGKWYLKNDQLNGWSNFVTVRFPGPSGSQAVTGDWQ